MPLTPLQRKTLIRYNELRNEPLTTWQIVGKALPRFLIGLILPAIAAFTLPPGVAYFCVGMLLGAFLRQVALTRQAMFAMPALLDVIDWAKVAALLGESAPPHPPGPMAHG